jgi:virginiamycin B lyase
VELLPLETILDAADGASGEDDDWFEVSLLGEHHGTLRPFPGAVRPRGRERLSALGALAAVLALALLATAIFTWQRPASQGITIHGVGTMAVFRLPTAGSQPRLIVAGRDGNVWFSEDARIGRITPQGVITEFPLPASVIINGLAAGPDGNIWFTDSAGKIGRLSPQNGSVIEFRLPTHNMTPVPIVAGPDGNFWFGAGDVVDTSSGVPLSLRPEIGRISLAGTIKEFPLPAGSLPPTYLTVGPDGNLWFADGPLWGDNMIGRISLAGTIKEFQVPTFNAVPGAIVTGQDHNLWFVADLVVDPGSIEMHPSLGEIGRITPAGNVTEFPLPKKPGQAAAPTELTAGPDGNIWFVVADDHALGRITPQGDIAEFALPAGITLSDITIGPDGALWFTDTVAGTIDRIELYR